MKKLVVLGAVTMVLFTSTSFAGERLSLGYIYSASKSHTEIVEATNGGVNVVSPTTFDLKTNGTLEINPISDEEFVQNMHEQGITVTPFLSNHWGRKRAEAALNNPEKLIAQLVEAIELYNYDGINVDLENLDTSYKDKLTNFMRLLREALPEDKVVSIAVAANPDNLTTTWVAAYDYKALAEYVDYMVVMAYDEHCYGGSAGPVASIDFVEKSLKGILEEVSRDKIVLGIPLYGRFWQEGKDVGGEAIIMGQMPRILTKYKLVPKYDVNTETPHVTVKVKEGQKGPYVNGRYLEAGTYTIYYENENSIKAKLALANKYDILGTGLWAIDNESADLWSYYKESLNATPYETELEVKIREKLDYAQKFFVGQTVEAAQIVDVVDYIKENVSLQRIENNKIQLVEATERIEENLLEGMHPVKKIKHIKMKRFLVRMRNLKN
ncbi:MAG: hypothetical protein IJ215_03715, partial [Clostridia bacterium]|nr:hypothetical protein [Clostridia bacterium]